MGLWLGIKTNDLVTQVWGSIPCSCFIRDEVLTFSSGHLQLGFHGCFTEMCEVLSQSAAIWSKSNHGHCELTTLKENCDVAMVLIDMDINSFIQWGCSWASKQMMQWQPWVAILCSCIMQLRDLRVWPEVGQSCVMWLSDPRHAMAVIVFRDSDFQPPILLQWTHADKLWHATSEHTCHALASDRHKRAVQPLDHFSFLGPLLFFYLTLSFHHASKWPLYFWWRAFIKWKMFMIECAANGPQKTSVCCQ